MLHPIAPGHDSRSYSWRMHRDDSSAGTVRGVAIDSLALTDVDLIKLDIEGHELPALLGAHETIMRCRPVVVIEEKHDPECKATAYLQQLGMRMRAQLKRDYVFGW